jgi:hypothetical protein
VTESGITQLKILQLPKGSVGSRPIHLIGADDFWMVTVSLTIGYFLHIKVFSFILRNEAQPIKEGQFITTDRAGDLRAKLDVAAGFATLDQSETSLVEVDNLIGDTPLFELWRIFVLTRQLTNNQHRVAPMSTCCKKRGTKAIRPRMLERFFSKLTVLLLNGFANLTDPGPYLLGDG